MLGSGHLHFRITVVLGHLRIPGGSVPFSFSISGLHSFCVRFLLELLFFATQRLRKVWKIKWFMGKYGAKTPKPHLGFANVSNIGKLYNGKLTKREMKDMKAKTSTTRVYLNKLGKKCWSGTRALKQSQFPGKKMRSI